MIIATIVITTIVTTKMSRSGYLLGREGGEEEGGEEAGGEEEGGEEAGETSVVFEYGGIFPKSAAIERNSITSSRRESSSYLYT